MFYNRKWLIVVAVFVIFLCACVVEASGTDFLFYSPLLIVEEPSPQPVSRGEFYSMLAEAANIEVNGTVATNMADVQPYQSYTGGVVWAISNGIAECESTTEFGVNEPIRRWEIAQALYRYHCNVQATSLTDLFSQTAPDLGGLTPEPLAAIGYTSGAEVICRCEDGLFQPFSTVELDGVNSILDNFFSLPPVSSNVATMTQSVMSLDEHKAAEQEVIEESISVEAEPRDDETWVEAQDGWTGDWTQDFPLTFPENVDYDSVVALNQRMLKENIPAYISPLGESVDGVENHVTNYGTYGRTDCINVVTILENKTSDVPAGLSLWGRQQYYGYSLQIIGIDQQDVWHAEAEETGKDPWQCTWWAWGRAAQYMELRYGVNLLAYCGNRETMGNGQNYYYNLLPYFLSDSTPMANSMVSWSGASFGHVAYVEAVDDYGIWVSMADSGRTWRGITYIVKVDSASNPYPLGWYANEEFLGFNHLDYDANGWQFAEIGS